MYKKLFFALLPFVAACNIVHTPPSPYKGYTAAEGGMYFKYGDMSTNNKKAREGDVLELNISYSKMNDSLFWDSRDIGYPYVLFESYYDLEQGDSYQKLLLTAGEGDSLNYIVPAYPLFTNVLHTKIPYFLGKDDMMKVNVRVNALLSKEQFAIRLERIKKFKEDLDLQEQVDLQKYVQSNHIPDSMKHNNVYLVPTKKGIGVGVKAGDLISITYTGHFLSGRVFDSVSIKAPLQFRFGDTAQVVRGLEIALKKMIEGEQAKIIIPSQLAFGESGSSTGIVPPYTTVVYEVTLMKVN